MVKHPYKSDASGMYHNNYFHFQANSMITTYRTRFLNTGAFSKDLICTQEWSKEKLQIVSELAAEMKKSRFSKEWVDLLSKRSFLMLFHNSSTRTRLSFEAAITELGANPVNGYAKIVE